MSGDQRRVGILLNFLTEGVKILSALLYTPLMLRLLGQREYGLYQLAVSLISWLGLLNFGFGSGYLRQFARYQVRGDEAGISRLNGMFTLIFGSLAVLSLLCGGVLTAHAPWVLGGGLTPKELEKAEVLLKMLTLNLALTLGGSLFDCHITAREQFLFQKLLRLVQAACSPFLTLPLLLLGYGSEAVVLVSLVLTGAVFLGNGIYCRKKLHMALSFRNLRLWEQKKLWIFVFFVFLNQVIDQVNWSVDKILLGRMQGTAAVAVYGVGAQINSLYLQMSTAISAVFAPKVHRLAAQSGDTLGLSRLLAQVGSVQAAVLGLPLTGFLLFGRAFLALWAGSGYEEAYRVALLLMVPVTVPLVQNLGIEIQRAWNQHQTRSMVYACLAAGNVLLSTLLIPRWGCTGAAAGTAVSLILGNGLFMNWYYQKRLKLDMGLFWKRILEIIPVWILAFSLGMVLLARVDVDSWGTFLGAVFLYSAGYAVLLVLWIKKKRGQENSCPRGIMR